MNKQITILILFITLIPYYVFTQTKSSSFSLEQGLFTETDTTQNNFNYVIEKDSHLISHSYFDSTQIPPSTMARSSLNGCIVHDLLIYNKNLVNKIKNDKCHYSVVFPISVSDCNFTRSTDQLIRTCDDGEIPVIEIKDVFSLENSSFYRELPLKQIRCSPSSGGFNLQNDTAEYLDIRDCQFQQLNVNGNNLNHFIFCESINANIAVFGNNRVSNSCGYLTIENSTFKTGLFLIDNYTNFVTLSEDTLEGVLKISYSKPISKSKTITFYDSYVNAQCDIQIPDSIGLSKLIFSNCTFGHSARLLDVQIDTLVFENCTNIPYPLFLTANSSKKEIYIELINSNVNNIRFDYTEKFKLFFDKTVSEETKNSTYQSLFAKYKAEGKPENIEKIDIEYKRYQYKSNWLMYPIWLLDYIWWRYGYSKWLVILWTFVFLVLFFNYNYKNWDGMRRIYGVFDKDELAVLSKLDKNKRNKRKAAFVLLYTSFIFFSLRIDFDKLKYANTKYLTAFFTQYVVGLICLFFLANAIFKL